MNQDSNSFNRVFKTLTLSKSQIEDQETDQSPRSKIFQPFPCEEFLTQRSFSIIHEEVKQAAEEEEEKKEPCLDKEKESQQNAEGVFERMIALKRKRIPNQIREELKNIRLTVDKIELKEAPILVSLQRKYPIEAKKKVVELTKKIGAMRVARHTGIPETSVRRLSKTGIDRVGKSGRKPQYVEIEKELKRLFSDFRGIQMTNRLLLIEEDGSQLKKGCLNSLGVNLGWRASKKEITLFTEGRLGLLKNCTLTPKRSLRHFKINFWN